MTDPSADLVGFVRALREAGLAVGIEQVAVAADALSLISITERRQVYCGTRAVLVTRPEDVAVFDEVFARWFGDAGAVTAPRKLPPAPRHDRSFVKTSLGAYMAERAAASSPEVPLSESVKAASALEQLQRKDFALCTEAERETIARALVELDVTRRRSRRRVGARRGREIDLAAAVRRSARQGGTLLALPRRQHKWKRRPLVVLADISGSMELYSRLVLQFLHALSTRYPTEVFVFGTRLTRITPQLALRDLDAALDRVAADVVDYAGGTRIGACLHAFARSHARRVVRRGAVVLVISDGLDTGEPDVLAREVRALHERAHRLVWLNPLVGGAGYQPIAEGMAAALPYIDDFLPVRDLRSLSALARHLAAIPRRRGAKIYGAGVR